MRRIARRLLEALAWLGFVGFFSVTTSGCMIIMAGSCTAPATIPLVPGEYVITHHPA